MGAEFNSARSMITRPGLASLSSATSKAGSVSGASGEVAGGDVHATTEMAEAAQLGAHGHAVRGSDADTVEIPDLIVPVEKPAVH